MLLNIIKCHAPNEIKKFRFSEKKISPGASAGDLDWTSFFAAVVESSVTFRRCKYCNTAENSSGSRNLLPLDNATHQCITSTVRASIPKV